MFKYLTILLLLPSLTFADYGRIYVDSVVKVYDGDTFFAQFFLTLTLILPLGSVLNVANGIIPKMSK